MTEAGKVLNEQRGEEAGAAEETLVVSTPNEDARLRAMIRAELDRQHALPVARRTLELLVETGTEPIEGEPGYRIIDRSGDTRLRPVSPEQAKKGVLPDTPLTLSAFVDELRERHPELFGTAPPEPETTAVELHETLQERVANVKAASARFVQTQSTLAKSLAANSAERGRALAAAAGETVGTWRERIDTRLKPERPVEPDPGRTETTAASTALPVSNSIPLRPDWPTRTDDAAARFTRGAASLREQMRNAIVGRRDAPEADGASGSSRRRVYAFGGAGLAALALLVIVLRPNQQADNETVQEPAAPRQQAEAPPAQSSPPQETAPKPSPQPSPSPAAPQQNSAPANPPADAEEQPDEAPARAPNELTGVADVIDTATLRIAGKVVHLFGVEWVRGGQADELTKYLAKRPVSCQPAPGSTAHLCTVNGRDLSEVVLFNGGGRASSEAGPELVAAEDHARSERLGVWKR